MKYILKKLTYDGAPTANEEGVIAQNLLVTSGIEGDNYGFERVDQSVATSSMSKTGDAIQKEIEDQAKAFIANKYPNT